MPFTYTETIVKSFTVSKIKRNFMPFAKLSITRKDVTSCSHCHTAFKPSDNTNLAFVDNDLNQLFCDKCAKLALENGADEIVFGKSK